VSDDDETGRLNAKMADAVQEVAGEIYPGDMVTRWVALIETFDSQGVRALIVSAQPGSKPWDTLGMLAYATQIEQAALTRSDPFNYGAE
jgi:hypothetical protein